MTVFKDFSEMRATSLTSSILALYGTAFFVGSCTLVPYLSRLEKKRKLCERLQKLALSQRPRHRKIWSVEKTRFNDHRFLCIFCMEKECFDELATRIEEAVGSDTFKSEQYLQDLKAQGTSTARG